MKINVLLNLGKKPSGAARPIIEFCNVLAATEDVVIYKGFNPNRKGFEYFLREAFGFLMKGRKYCVNWTECKCPITIVPSYKEKFIRDADITFFRSVHLAGEVAKWNGKKGIKIMRVSNVHMLNKPVEIAKNIIFIASSTMVYEKLRILYPEHRIFRVGNGVNCSYFSYTGKNLTEPKSIGMIFYAGKDSRHKGVEAGFQVMRKIKEKFPKMRFITAGLKREKTIPDFVEFIKGLTSEDMLSFYRNADIFIYPSLEDAWPNPPMEAVACGCALVTTDVGGIRDFVTDRETAMICRPGDVEGMVQAVEFLIKNPDFWKKLIYNGTMRIKQFDYFQQATLLRKVFYEILSTS